MKIGSVYPTSHFWANCGYGTRHLATSPVGEVKQVQAYGEVSRNKCLRYDYYRIQKVSHDQWKVLGYEGSRYPV
jgi:hypothetical protein